jgi:hypothetical protein
MSKALNAGRTAGHHSKKINIAFEARQKIAEQNLTQELREHYNIGYCTVLTYKMIDVKSPLRTNRQRSRN